MELIAPLASGIAAAASGTAEFYRAGTTTVATVYAYDASSMTYTAYTSQSHTLNSAGSIVRYCDERVDVVVRSSAAAEVVRFTMGGAAAATRLDNAGFDATNVDAAFSAAYTSFGDENWTVNGQYIKDVLGASSSVFFNVKSSSYGAVGNGTNDDTGGIQAAINAAVAAGGGIVYFPPGTYSVTGAITVGANVTLLGASADASVIMAADLVNTAMQFNSASLVIGLKISKVTSVNPIAVAVNAAVRFVGCKLDKGGSTSTSGTPLSVGSGGYAYLYGSEVNGYGSIATVHGSGFLYAVASKFSGVAAPAANSFLASGGSVGPCFFSSCEFDYSTLAVGSFTLFAATAAMVSAVACRFRSGGATIFSLNGASGNMNEAGCFFDSNVSRPTVGASRELSYKLYSVATTTCTIDAGYGKHVVSHTAGASMAFSLTGSADAGTIIIEYKNATGGAITPTFSASFKIGTAPSVGNGQTACFMFAYDAVSGLFRQVGANAIAYTT